MIGNLRSCKYFPHVNKMLTRTHNRKNSVMTQKKQHPNFIIMNLMFVTFVILKLSVIVCIISICLFDFEFNNMHLQSWHLCLERIRCTFIFQTVFSEDISFLSVAYRWRKIVVSRWRILLLCFPAAAQWYIKSYPFRYDMKIATANEGYKRFNLCIHL
jgi:uncharacterized BrkB/YihY/UPF0761 family membrane protein